MPTKIRTARSFGALRGVQEDRDLVQLLLGGLLSELGHDRVAELARIGHVGLEERDALASGADRRKVRGALVRRAGAEIRMAGRASRLREEHRALHGRRIVLEALFLRP